MAKARSQGTREDLKALGKLRYNDVNGASHNASVIQDRLDDHKLSTILEFGAGRIYVNSCLTTRAVRGGPHICGVNGVQNEVTENDYGVQISDPASSVVGSTTVFIFTGTTGSTYDVSSIWRTRGVGAVMQDFVFQGRRITANSTYTGSKCDYGLSVDTPGLGGVNPAKMVIRGCSFIQCGTGIYIPPSGQSDSILIEGVIWEEGCDRFMYVDEEQCLGLQLTGFLTCHNDDPAFICFDYSGYSTGASGGKVNCTGQIQFNRAGTLLKTGKQVYSSSGFKFTDVIWDHAIQPNYTWPKVLIMTQPNELNMTAAITLSNETSADYRRPLIWPIGDEYNIQIHDTTNRLHQVDRDAWCTRGEYAATDECMDFTPTGVSAWWHFGDPTKMGNPADGDTVETIEEKSADTNDLSQSTSGSRAAYDEDGMHHRPCLKGDGKYYTATTPIGAGATALNVEWAGWMQTNGTNNRTIASLSGGSTSYVWGLQWNANGTISFFCSQSGAAASTTNITSTATATYFQQTYIRAWFTAGSGGTGRIGISVNGVSKIASHSLTALYNSGSPTLYVGAQKYGASASDFFSGRMYDLKIDTTMPSDAELALRRDSICSQIGTPVDVFVPMDITNATNATPIVVTTGTEAHGMTTGRFVTITGLLINSISAAAYDHTGNGEGERHLSLTGGFTNYTFTTGDQLVVTAATGGVAVGTYTIASKVDSDAILLSAAGGLTADATGITATISSAAINTTHKITTTGNTTFSLQDVNGTNVAGKGVYASGGTVTQI